MLGSHLQVFNKRRNLVFFSLLKDEKTSDRLLSYYEGDKNLVLKSIQNLKSIPYVPFLPSEFTLYSETNEIVTLKSIRNKAQLSKINKQEGDYCFQN